MLINNNNDNNNNTENSLASSPILSWKHNTAVMLIAT